MRIPLLSEERDTENQNDENPENAPLKEPKKFPEIIFHSSSPQSILYVKA
jgi:hypothetical protein